MIVLGIESSCDETAAAIVRDGRVMVSSVISSQVDVHKRFGGVVPVAVLPRLVQGEQRLGEEGVVVEEPRPAGPAVRP